MSFNSFAFLFFFIGVLVVYWLPLPWTLRKFNLLAASYVFYAAWDVRYLALLLYSTALNGIAANALDRFDCHPKRRRRIFWTSVILNLGPLAFFKYGNQVLGLYHSTAAAFGISSAAPHFSIMLPVGLSFFTFQAMSYTIDVYRRTIRPAGSLLDLALFVAFFPVLLAGPLLRAGQFLPQCKASRRLSEFEFGYGLSLLTLGLFLKVALADHLLAPIVRQVFAVESRPDMLSAWMGTFAFAGQDYCDFAGYSTCAMGIGLCLGFVLPENFRAPMASVGFRDLWQRWHITLVAWMRDYVFMPLGGIYRGYTRAAINVMITMLLIGLWHGANWTFVAFGFLHGAYLVGETFLQRTRLRRLRIWRSGIGVFCLWALTFVLCLVAFVFYRSATVEQSFELLTIMFGGTSVGSPFHLFPFDLLIAGMVMSSLIVAHWLCRETALDAIIMRVPKWSLTICLALMLIAITLTSGEGQTFLYFQY
jgi:alginate O-acetyltransferase complex protein AlgI